MSFGNSYNAFGSWIDFGRQLSVKQREEVNRKAQDILIHSRENLTEADFNVLRQYSGWGGVQTDDRGVLYDFYTSPPIANMTWRLLDKVQPLKEGEAVLEPSCGTGVFFETAPKGLDLNGVELSPTTAQIASILHSDATVFMGSFEQFNLINKDKFDRVIGNAPFGERTISTSFMDLPAERNLDRYFISRSLDNLADGGTMALIVHPGVTDNESNKTWRLEMCKKAEFLGAIRLSNTSFRHTHTQVQPDILLFKKHPEDIQRRFEAMNDTDFEDIQFYSSSWVDGEYFRENQQNIMGNVIEGAGQWGSDVIKGEITQENIERTINQFELDAPFTSDDFEKIRKDHELPEPTATAELIVLSQREAEAVSLRELTTGSNKTIDGKLYKLTDTFQWQQVGTEGTALPDKIEIIQSIGRSVKTIRSEMQFGRSVDDLQIQTRKQIENYKELYGVIPSEDKKVSAFLQKNPSLKGVYEGLLSIDADILNKANIYDTDTELIDGHNPAIATLVKMQERMLPATVENLTKLHPDFENSLHGEMLQNPDIFLTPDNEFQLREDFISGNAWQKIDGINAYIATQEESLELSDTHRQYIEKLKYGVSELEEAIGWVSIEEADFTPHASWIPESIIDEWIKDKNGLDRSKAFVDATVCRNDSDKWGVKHTRDFYEAGKTWRDKSKNFEKGEWREYANDVIYYLNMQKQRSSHYDTETYNSEHDEGFKSWIANHDEHRTNLEKIYNKTFNTEISAPTKTYPVHIENWQETKTLKPHQWQNIHKLYREGCGISALGTGFGKTLSAVGLMSLLQQEGKIARSWVQVPNNKVKDWVEETRGVRPDLSVGFVDPEMASYSNQAKRYAMYQEIANTKHDIVIMPESAASEIQLSVKNDVEISENVISHHMIERGEGKNARGKAMAQEKTTRQLVNGKTNLTIHFEDFGCDAIFVDEAHRFKNLFSSSLSRETGLNDGRQSQKALSLFKKTEYIRQQHDNKNVFLFTATPLTNSPLEYYNMMQYVAPQELHRFGIRTIDGFIKNFSDIELRASPDWGSSSIKEKKTVVGFKNLRTLQDLFFKYTDLQNDPQAINLDKPTAQNRPNVIPMNAEQTGALKSISERLEQYRDATSEVRAKLFASENFLTFYMRMRTASLDLELYDPVTYKDWSNDKLAKLAQNAQDSYKATNGGQVVFCDRVMSGDGSFNMHGKIKDYLVKSGFKESEIVIVNGFTKSGGVQSDTVKEKEVSGAVAGYNSGKYKVIIGSTATIGEGLNLQENSAALHHFDIPYRPSDFIQRNGRIDRQGNKQQSVELHSYMATGTIDNYSVSLVQTKSAWIDQLLKTKSNVFTNPEGEIADADELLLALTEEWGDKEKAQERREEIQQKKEALFETAQNDKRKGNLASLSLMRCSIHGFEGDKGTVQYQNRIRKIHMLEKSLVANPSFHNHEIINNDVPFLYSKATDKILKKGDIVFRSGRFEEVTFLNRKKQELTFTDLSNANRSPIEKVATLKPNSIPLHIPHPTEEERNCVHSIVSRTFGKFENPSLQERLYPYALRHESPNAAYSEKPVFFLKKENSLVATDDNYSFKIDGKNLLNPYNAEDKRFILANIDSMNYEYNKERIDEKIEKQFPQLLKEIEAQGFKPKKSLIASFDKDVADFCSGHRKPKNDLFTIGNSSSVMNCIGGMNSEIVMSTAIINKAINKHNIPVELLQKIPEMLYDPIAVFKSDTVSEAKQNSVLFITNQFIGDKPLAFGIELQKEKQIGRQSIVVNDIRTIHARDLVSEKSGHGIFEGWVKEGLLQYVNDKKITDWEKSARVSFPLEFSQSDKLTIPCKSNLVNGHVNNDVPSESIDTVFKQGDIIFREGAFLEVSFLNLKEQEITFTSLSNKKYSSTEKVDTLKPDSIPLHISNPTEDERSCINSIVTHTLSEFENTSLQEKFYLYSLQHELAHTHRANPAFLLKNEDILAVANDDGTFSEKKENVLNLYNADDKRFIMENISDLNYDYEKILEHFPQLVKEIEAQGFKPEIGLIDNFVTDVPVFFAGIRTARGNVFSVGNSSSVMNCLGGMKKEILISADVMNKAKHENNMSLDVLKQLPEIIYNPIAVFKSDTVHSDAQKSNFVFIANELNDRNPIAIDIKLQKEKHTILVTDIRSIDRITFVSTKSGYDVFEGWGSKGQLQYVNDKTIAHRIRGTGTVFPIELSKSDATVATKSNIVKAYLNKDVIESKAPELSVDNPIIKQSDTLEIAKLEERNTSLQEGAYLNTLSHEFANKDNHDKPVFFYDNRGALTASDTSYRFTGIKALNPYNAEDKRFIIENIVALRYEHKPDKEIIDKKIQKQFPQFEGELVAQGFQPEKSFRESFYTDMSDFFSGHKNLKDNVFSITNTSSVMNRIDGIKNEITISTDVINEAKNNHNIPLDVLKRLPEIVYNPIAIFKSDTVPSDPQKKNAFFITNQFSDYKPIFIDIEFQKQNIVIKGFRVIDDVSTMVSSEKGQDLFQSWVSKDLLQYVNDKDIGAWMRSNKMLFPLKLSKLDAKVATKSNIIKDYLNKDVIESKTPEKSVDIPCHNPITGQIYTQERVSEHQKQSQSDDKRYLQPHEIAKRGMTIKEGAEPVVNTYSKTSDSGQSVQHCEMLFNGKDIQGMPPPKNILDKVHIVPMKILGSEKTMPKQAERGKDEGAVEM